MDDYIEGLLDVFVIVVAASMAGTFIFVLLRVWWGKFYEEGLGYESSWYENQKTVAKILDTAIHWSSRILIFCGTIFCLSMFLFLIVSAILAVINKIF